MSYISSSELRAGIIASIKKSEETTPFFSFGGKTDPVQVPPRRSGRLAAAAAAGGASAGVEEAAAVVLLPPAPPAEASKKKRAVAQNDVAAAAVVLGTPSRLTPAPRSAIDGWSTDMPFQINLTTLCDGAEFIVTEEDYAILSNFKPKTKSNVTKARELFARIPEWTNVGGTNSRFEHGSSSSLTRTKFLGSGTYGTAFDARYNTRDCVVKMIRLEDIDKATNSASVNQEILLKNVINTIKETIIHIALMDVCLSHPEILAAQAAEKMARVPEIYGLFRTSGKGFVKGNKKGALTAEDTEYIVIIMEKLDAPLDSFLESFKGNQLRTSTVGAVSLYQLAALLHVLGQTLQYNHRDMKLDNAMVKISSSERSLCGVPHFQTYIIDFGCSRMDYRGKLFTCNQELFAHGPKFNPAHDLTYAAWSYRHTIGCRVNLSVPCAHYIPLFDEILKAILRSSGINFDSDFHEYTDGLTATFYTGLADAGEPEELQKMMKIIQQDNRGEEDESKKIKSNVYFTSLTNIHNDLITPHGIKLMTKHVVRIIGQMCHPDGRHSIPAEETKVLELIALHGLEEDDDEAVVSDVSDA